jgi:hypothetical protein
MTTRNIYDLAQTWNDGATDFTAIKMNVTDTASAATSKLLDLQVGGVSRVNFPAKDSSVLCQFANTGYKIRLGGVQIGFGNAGLLTAFDYNTGSATLVAGAKYGWTSSTSYAAAAPDLFLARDAANTLAQRNSTNAQAFNIYNTYTDASNYERGFMKWNSNVLEIGTEAAGTGTIRSSKFGQGSFFILATSSKLELRCGDSANHLIHLDGTGQYFGPAQWAGEFDLGRTSYPWRNIFLRPSASLTPSANGDLCIEATDNTTLTFKLKGSDGTIRSGTIALA